MPLAHAAGCTATDSDVMPRRRVLGNGVVCVYLQCKTCGHSRAGKKSEFIVDALCPFDEQASQAWWSKKNEEDKLESAARVAEREIHDREVRDAWFSAYSAYLRSSQWREQRSKKLRACDGRCEARLPGCTVAATQVHHLKYDFCPVRYGEEFRDGFCEPLFDLKAVCDNCHDKIEWMKKDCR